MSLAQAEQLDSGLDAMNTRQALSKVVMKLFQLWNLSTADQLELLGLSPKSRSMLAKYARGDALPATRDIQDRVGWLLAIHKALRLLYPRNPEIRYSWVTRRNAAFDNLPPLAVMKEQGLLGVARVSRYLDFYRGH
jgi:hypothetical protein